MKQAILLLLVISSFTVQAQEKLKFERLSSMPNPAAAFSMAQSEHDIYAIGGSNWTQWVSSGLQIYDSKAEIWIEMPLNGIPRFNNGAALYLDNHDCIMLAGGIMPYGSSLNLVDSIYAVYPDSREVRNLGATPAPAKKMGLAYHNEKVYMFGGSTTMRMNHNGTRIYTFSDNLWEYDLFSGRMTQLPDMPIAMESQGGIINGNLYLFGGFDQTSRSTVFKYNIESKTWTELPRLKKTVTDPALIQYKHYFILVGDQTKSNQLIVYDTQTEQARYFKTNLEGRRLGASILGDELHVYGGLNTRLGVLKQEHYMLPIEKIIGMPSGKIELGQ